MTFRPATVDDAALLYGWRIGDEVTVDYPSSTTFDAHRDWLTERVRSPLVKLLVWEVDDSPAGMVRIDSNGEVAFHADNDETAAAMLRAVLVFAGEYGGRLKATLDAADAKTGLLEAAGFARYPATFLAYKP